MGINEGKPLTSKEIAQMDKEDAVHSRYDEIRAEANKRFDEKKAGKLVTTKDLGLSPELCDLLGIEPNMTYEVDEAKRQELMQQAEMIIAYGGVLAAKYVIAVLGLLIQPDKGVLRAAEFVLGLNLGSAPQRIAKSTGVGEFEVMMEETRSITRAVLVKGRHPDDNGSGKAE